MKKLTIAMLSAAVLCSGACKSSKTEQTEPQESKAIVLYYSQTGATRAIAEEIQERLGCDIDSIVCVNPYDGDYGQTIARWMQERTDSVKVGIKPLNVNLDDYDTIFLGFPIWGGTYASPMATFLADNKLDGKKVYTFATFGSGGIEKATLDVSVALPGAEVIEGVGVRNARVAKSSGDVQRFLVNNGFLENNIEPLLEFTDNGEMTDEERAIFHAACDNYQFPLGIPVAVVSRPITGGTEYAFTAKSTGPDGKETNAIIYVEALENETPEFTRVVRE